MKIKILENIQSSISLTYFENLKRLNFLQPLHKTTAAACQLTPIKILFLIFTQTFSSTHSLIKVSL